MKKNYLYIFILIVLVGGAIYLLTQNKGGTIDSIKKDFAVEDTAAVTKVFIAEKSGRTVTVERQPNRTWLVNGKYQARKELIRIVLETLKQMRIKSPVNKPMREMVMKKLATSATKVEVYEGNKKIKTLYIGSSTADGLGTFMLIEGSDEPFITYIPGFDGYLNSRFTSEEEVWRDREVFRISPDRIDMIKVDYPNDKKGSFTLKIENNQLAKLTNGEGAAASGINGEFLRQYLSFFTDAQYESLIRFDKSKQDSLLYPGNLLAVITVFDKEGNKKSASFYQRFYDGTDFLQKGEASQSDPERLFVLTDKSELANGQRRIFDKMLVKYPDFSGPAQKIID